MTKDTDGLAAFHVAAVKLAQGASYGQSADDLVLQKP